MTKKRAIIIAETLARRVIPELHGVPVYIHQPTYDGRVTFDMIGNCSGMYCPNLDIVMKPELEARGEWNGRGVGVIVDGVTLLHPLSGFDEYERERRVIGTVMHEIVHWCDLPQHSYTPKSDEAYDRFRAGCEARTEPQASKYPVELLTHSDSWQRLAVHIHYRCAHGGGYRLGPHHLAIGNSYKSGLEFLPSGPEFVEALYDEVRELDGVALREISAREQPIEFVRLWDRVLERFVTPAVA